MSTLDNFHVPSNQCDLVTKVEPEFVSCRMEDSEEVSQNIKQELCDSYEDDDCFIVNCDTDGTHSNLGNVKPDPEDCAVQNLVFSKEFKEESNSLHCEACGDDYDLYCSKCPMLVRILDANLPNKIEDRIKQTLPKDLFDIREISSGAVGVIALRTIPQGVILGPVEGVVPIIEGNTSKWKVNEGKLDYLEDPKCLNWMHNIRYSDELFLRNLMPFQCEDQLFYQSTRLIEEGEEMLVCFDNCNSDDDDYIQFPVIKEELENVYACTFCCLGFSSITFLLKHNTICQGKKGKDTEKDVTIAQCQYCNIYLLGKELFKMHSDSCCTRKSNRRLTDNVSELRVEKVEDQEEDESEEAVMVVAKRFKCSRCSFDTAYEKRLDKHLLSHGQWNMESPKLEKNKSKAKRFKCSECPYETDVKRCLTRHGYIHAAEKPFKCGACGRGYTCRNGLKTHIRTLHPEIALQCITCKFQSRDRRELQEHLKLAHAHKCTTCGYETNVRSRFNQHVLIHTGAKKFQCGHCEKLFTSKSNLKVHLDTVHNVAKRYRCSNCVYQTNRKASYQQHIMIHDEDTIRYRCEICDLGFKRQMELRHHDEQCHMSVEQKYECNLCKVGFPRRSALVKHVQLVHVHDAEKFLCAVCGYATDREDDLAEHRASVHRREKKPFECVACDVGFGTVGSLKTHNKRKHPNGIEVATSSAASRIKEELVD